MRKWIVFDRKAGYLGIKRYTRKDEDMGSNYCVDLIDPINFKTIKTVRAHGPDYDWHNLSLEDPRVQFIKLFDIFEGGIADWYHGFAGVGECCDDVHIDEAYVENPHEVFELIRKAFMPEKQDRERRLKRYETRIEELEARLLEIGKEKTEEKPEQEA